MVLLFVCDDMIDTYTVLQFQLRSTLAEYRRKKLLNSIPFGRDTSYSSDMLLLFMYVEATVPCWILAFLASFYSILCFLGLKNKELATIEIQNDGKLKLLGKTPLLANGVFHDTVANGKFLITGFFGADALTTHDTTTTFPYTQVHKQDTSDEPHQTIVVSCLFW